MFSLAASALIATLVLRETGFIGLDLYVFRSTTQTSEQVTTTRISVNRKQVDLASVALAPEVVTKIETVAAKTVVEALREMHVPGSGAEQGQLKVELQRLDLGGFYWAPLYKCGSCAFAASYELKAKGAGGSATVNGQVQGNIECIVTGACSTCKYRQIIGQKVADEVETQIRKHLVKEKADYR